MGSLNVQKLTWKQLRITNVNHNTRGHKNTKNTKCCVKMIQNDDKITTKCRFLYRVYPTTGRAVGCFAFHVLKGSDKSVPPSLSPEQRVTETRNYDEFILRDQGNHFDINMMTHNTAKQQSSFWHFTLSPHHYVSSCIHGSHFSVCVSHFSLLPYDSL